MYRKVSSIRKTTPSILMISTLAAGTLVAPNAEASDGSNRCVQDPLPASANISLPEDDQFHYPSQWTGAPEKANDLPGALESMYTSYKWTATPVGGGDPITVEGTTMFVAVEIPSPFAGGAVAWVRALTIGFLVEDAFINYAYFAPGEFTPTTNSMDLSLGGPGDTVMEVTSQGLTPVDPSILVGRLVSASGTDSLSITTSDGFEIQVDNESTKAPIYPWDDGYSTLWGYYWARPMLASEGEMTYNGETYELIGEGWSEREWGITVPDLSVNYMERHISVQIEGCVAASGTIDQCVYKGTTILAFDVRDRVTGDPAIHEYLQVGPSPQCYRYDLQALEDWSIIPLEIYTSPLGIEFATKLRLVAPSRGVDLVLEARVPNQHMFRTQGLLPNWYEGAADLSGTINGNPVAGAAMIESFNIPNGAWHD